MPAELRSRHSLAAGACVGLATGVVIAVADLVRAHTHRLVGSRPAFAAYVVAFLALAGMLTGAGAGLWRALAARVAAGIQRPSVARGVFVLACSVPLIAFLAWVPSHWTRSHWALLTPLQRACVVALYGALFGSSLLVTYAAVCWSARSRQRPLPAAVQWAMCAALLATAGVLYWADASIYPGLYAELHVGLVGALVLCVAASSLIAGQALGLGHFVDARTRPRALLLAAAVASTGAVVGTELARPNIFDQSGTLVFSKALSLARWLTDFDRDGASALFGGSDCTAFDAERGPDRLDIPQNGVDEDCTGNDASWPPQLKLPPAAREPAPLNLILITVDSLRADHLSAYGYARNTSPNVAEWAAGAWLFARASSQDTKTWESTTSLFTGLYPSNLPRDYTHPRTRGAKDYVFYLAPDAPLLTEMLQARGYETRAASMLGLVKTIGLDRGFRRFDVTRQTNPVPRALRFLRAARRPFFLWVHLQWPHAPYKHHEGHDFGDTAIDRYDSEIAYTDVQIGRLLAFVRDGELQKNTIVVLTSDHGEEFGEHGSVHHGGPPYRVLTHVPLIISVPDEKPARIDSPVELVDVVPTICELVGFEEPCAGFDGQSLLATLRGQRAREYLAAYSENYDRYAGVQRRALYTGRWRFIQNSVDGRIELYDTHADPGEQHNVAYGNEAIWQPLLEQVAVRTTRGAALLLGGSPGTLEPRRLLQGLPRIRQPPLLELAIERLGQATISAAELELPLRRLLDRPGLSPALKHKVEALLLRGAPKG